MCLRPGCSSGFSNQARMPEEKEMLNKRLIAVSCKPQAIPVPPLAKPLKMTVRYLPAEAFAQAGSLFPVRLALAGRACSYSLFISSMYGEQFAG